VAFFLDGADTDISKLWDVLQILGNDGGISQDLPLDLHDGLKGDFGGACLTAHSFLQLRPQDSSWHRTKYI
jgi:hypothetical protein